MIYGLSHIEVPVTDLARAQRLYSGTLDFPVRSTAPGSVDLDARTMLLRLFSVRRVENTVSLRVQVADVAATWSRLVGLGLRELSSPERTSHLELSGTVLDPDGHALSLWRPLSEDEYGYVPEVPKAGAWTPEADALLKTLLLAVPSLFRSLARRKVAREAEELATHRAVDRETVIRAYIRSSARVTRGRLRGPLREQGIDCERYQADFDS
jgi:catechol 2,3-dioxygenase-like lactoylglutathione lyase family enzyme